MVTATIPQDCSLIIDLERASQSFITTATPREREQRYLDLLNVLCEYINNSCSSLLVNESSKPDPLQFIKMHLDFLQREKPLCTNFVKWLLTKLIITTASPDLREEVASNIRTYARDFVSYLNSNEEIMNVCLSLINQLKDFSSLTTFSLWNCGDNVPYFEEEKSINLEKLSQGEKENIISTLLEILTADRMPFTCVNSLSEHAQLALWMVTIERFSNGSLLTKQAVLSIWTQLIKVDAANWMVCRLAIDRLLQMEALQDVLCPTYSATKTIFYETFSKALQLFDARKSLIGLDLGSVIYWANFSIAIYLNSLKEKKEFLIRFAGVACEVLSSVELDMDDWKDMEECRLNACKLINYFFEHYNDIETDEILCPFVSLLSQAEVEMPGCDWISYVDDQQRIPRQQSNFDKLTLRRKFISVLQKCKAPAARKYLESLALPSESLLKFIEEADKNNDIPLFLTLTAMISDLTIAGCISSSVSLPFLSVPFLSTDSIFASAKQKRHSTPTLKEFIKFAPFMKKIDKSSEAEARIYAIVPLTKISGFSEWRRELYIAGLTDRNPKVAERALKHMHEFLISVETLSFRFLVNAALPLITDKSDIVMSSLAHCICILDYEKGQDINAYRCDICHGSGRKIEKKDEETLKIIVDLVDSVKEKWRDKNTIASLKLSCALLFHYPSLIPEGEIGKIPHWSETLVYLENNDEAVRKQYLHLFKHMVSSSDNERLSEIIQTKFPIYKAQMDDIVPDPLSAEYLTICAQYAKNKNLATWAFGKLYSIILGYQTFEFLDSMKNLVRDIAAVDEITNTAVFMRRIRTITNELCSYLISFGRIPIETANLESGIEEVIGSLTITKEIFFFNDVATMLKNAAKHIIPMLFMCEAKERPWVAVVIDKIREAMNIHKEVLGTEYIPYFRVQCILQNGINKEKNYEQFIYNTCGVHMANVTTRYLCTQGLLQMLSVDEKAICDGIAYVNRSHLNQPDFSLTHVLMINCEYVGHFLKFRWCLTAHDYYEHWPILLQSLEVIIQRVDGNFLEAVANRLMSVLRAATKVGEAAIPVWLQFATRLTRNTFKNLLPKILIDIQPLLQYDSSDDLISLILNNGSNVLSDLENSRDIHEREHIVQTTFVLIGCDINGSMRLQKYVERIPFKDRPSMRPDELIKTCVRLLSADCETVGKVVLQKLLSLLDGGKLNEELYSLLIPALLQTLRRCCDPECRILTVMCIGRLGAIDPGRLEISHTVYSDETTTFVDDKDDFFLDLIERTWMAYSREPEFEMLKEIECAIQELLFRLVDPHHKKSIDLNRLSDACKKDILPLKSTKLGRKKDLECTAQSPIVNNVANFSEWLQQCFVLGANRVRQEPIKYVFRALKWISNTTDTHYTRYILSQLILRLIIENDTDVIEAYIVEMETVLTHVVESGPSWVYLAAHIVFSILDTLELFVKHRKEKRNRNIDADPELKRTVDIIQAVASKTTNDDQLLIVIAAEKCNCFYRALKWCEQFAISKSTDRHAYFTLERIYASLQNVDGVLGAFEYISKSNPPTIHERILALEAAGDYHEAMALYALSGPRNEADMVKCLLRLNQPQLALCTATAAYSKYLNGDSISDTLYANQVEAACLLQDWKQLETLIQKRDPLTLGKRSTWGASCASILCAVKRQEPNILTKRLKAAREILVEQLTAMTIEHSDTYSQAYNYVTQLHILDEIEDASEALHLVSINQRKPKNDLSKLLTKWQTRSENAIQCAASLESILSVRRELLKLCTSENTKTNISQLLIQSCRLARQAGHLQIAWTFLVEAQSLDVNHKEVGLEQARFEFQKGDQQQAISLLTKLLSSRFDKMNEMFSEFVSYVESGRQLGTDAILSATNEDRASFAEVQLLRAEYMMKAGAVSSSDLYKIYMALRKVEVPSEDLFYRIALFCDNLYSLDSTNIRTDLVNIIMKTYADALKFGRNHLFHAMPRMLTLWLDCTHKKNEQLLSKQDEKVSHALKEAKEKDGLEIQKINGEMLTIFTQLDPYYFYKAFPQLISRIEHKNENVFDTLKAMLAKLLVAFPHQCLWLSIAVYRSGAHTKNIRQQRCNEIFQLAKEKDKRLNNLIDQYDYISQCLIRTAEQKYTFGSHDNFAEQFKHLYDFFNHGSMDTSLLMGARERSQCRIRRVQPTIMVPLTEMMDHAIPKSVQQQTESFSQIMINTPLSSEPAMGALPEVLIQKFENSYIVLKSMMQPKKLNIRSQDGRVFSIMVKPGDELRKDSRFMDMMNSLMRQNPEARRRQLSVRTFTVIPLQSAGGIIEWLPNLIGYRHALQPLFNEKSPKRMSDAEWFKCWDNTASVSVKLKKIEQYYECYPRVMAEWFRREFVDPSSWHSARSNYSRSAAVMSMIGFVLGLGDRHGENILIDHRDGCVVHVDFNLIFNKGEQLGVKEIVPFRLTRNIIDGLGPTGVEGSFRKSCEATLKVMRDNKDTLLTVIQAFVHDPLLEWQDSTRAQQNRSRRGEKITAGHLAADAVGLIGKRLEGHIVTPEVYRWNSTMSPMSLEGQVNKLIEIASDEKQLVQMYIGWAPFM